MIEHIITCITQSSYDIKIAYYTMSFPEGTPPIVRVHGDDDPSFKGELADLLE